MVDAKAIIHDLKLERHAYVTYLSKLDNHPNQDETRTRTEEIIKTLDRLIERYEDWLLREGTL